jgi:myo-inositol-1(or 4)-monophosphatase
VSPFTKDQDRALAERAVRVAGQILLRHWEAGVSMRHKSSRGGDVVTAADEEAEAAIVALLRAERPDDGVVGEEGARSSGERVWYVDALDGTYNFAHGVPNWCAAVALEGEVAAVYDPLADELFSGGGQLRADRPLREAAVSVFPPGGRVDELLPVVSAAASVRSGSSGTLDLAWITAGRIDAWVQPTPLPWDWHPGSLLVAQAGGRVEVLESGWHLAGTAGVVGELVELLRG